MWNPELSTCQWTFKRSSPQPTRPLKNLSLDIFNLICSTATKARSKILYYGLSSTRGKIILFCQLFPLVKKFYFCALTDFFFQFLSGNCTPIATFCSLSVPLLSEEEKYLGTFQKVEGRGGDQRPLGEGLLKEREARRGRRAGMWPSWRRATGEVGRTMWWPYAPTGATSDDNNDYSLQDCLNQRFINQELRK